MQIIIAYESNSINKSDYMYIKKAIKYFYVLYGNNIKLSPVSLNGKNGYLRVYKSVINLRKSYKGLSYVVYCLDYDRHIDSDNIELNKNIENYCRKNGYKLIWFNENIEEVFLGKRVEKNNKTKEATHFIRSNKIVSVDPRKLSCNHVSKKGTRNFLVVFDLLIGEYRVTKNSIYV